MRRTIGYLIKIIWPFLWTIIKDVFIYTLRTFLVMLIGMPRACQLIANDLKESIIADGFPSRYEGQLYVVCYVIAVFQYLIGWYILSWVTILVVAIIF